MDSKGLFVVEYGYFELYRTWVDGINSSMSPLKYTPIAL